MLSILRIKGRVQKWCILHIILFVWRGNKMSLICIVTKNRDKNNTNRQKSQIWECAAYRTHIVYQPTPGHFLPYQKARCEHRFRHTVCLITFFFFFFFSLSKWRKQWWKAAILLFALECVLLLNSALARSIIQICCLLFSYYFFRPPALCLPSLSPCHLPTTWLCVISVWCARNE